ncbi:MarR family winged helix-turn-helix transcriptional regulator [Streptomyces phytohabitans]|uniref:MarR family winged helix-turn-helix transcriptional regulator n=1 Tax=Streptomyces phytohabitans TaxID=1150371 RepID=UPI00345C202A
MSASPSPRRKTRRADSAADTDPDADAGTEAVALGTDFGWALRIVSTAFRRVGTESVAELPGGARGYLVLVALAGGEPPSQLALAKEVSLDRTVMTYLLDDLETQGLISRRPDPRDRRARQVLLTDAGRTRLDLARRSLAAAEARLFADLDADDAAQLRALLSRVARTAQREALGPDAPGGGGC